MEVRQFWKSRILLTAAELDIFTILDKNPATAENLSHRMRVDARCLRRLLDCLITFGILQKEESCYCLSEQGAQLSANHPQSVLPMVLHMNHLWNTWGDLTRVVQTGKNPARIENNEKNDAGLEAFIGAMHVVGRDRAGEIAASLDLSSFRRLLDVGGASGTYTMAFLSKNPDMTAIIFDLERVVHMAEGRLRAEGFLNRVDLVTGDFYIDELPGSCDVALLSAIIHQNSPVENHDLFCKVYRALEPRGMLIIRDHIMEEARTKPQAGALFAINMLVNTRGGDTYTFSEVGNNLAQAGFTEIKLNRSGEIMDCLVTARKPFPEP